MFNKLKTAAEEVKTVSSETPEIGIVLGSGLGDFVSRITEAKEIPFSKIPHFKNTTVQGHEGKLVLGKIKGVKVAVLQGRYHAYEGHAMEDVVFPLRLLSVLGIDKVILTNAAGGINLHYKPGDLVLITDHINMMGTNPLIGPNNADIGPRFPDMTNAYDLALQRCIQRAARTIRYNLKEGVYCALMGPTYETPAEVRMLGILGADMVGMSTVPETIAANHLGMTVAGISCITNMAAGLSGKKLSHEEVKETAEKVMIVFSDLLEESVSEIARMKT